MATRIARQRFLQRCGLAIQKESAKAPFPAFTRRKGPLSFVVRVPDLQSHSRLPPGIRDSQDRGLAVGETGELGICVFYVLPDPDTL